MNTLSVTRLDTRFTCFASVMRLVRPMWVSQPPRLPGFQGIHGLLLFAISAMDTWDGGTTEGTASLD